MYLKERADDDNIYTIMLSLTFSLLFLKTIFPITDLFWTAFTVTCFVCFKTVVCNRYVFSNIKPCLNVLNRDRIVLIALFALYILIDLVNTLYAEYPVITLKRYISFAEAIIVMVCLCVYCSIDKKRWRRNIGRVLLYFSYIGLFAEVITLVNFVRPFMRTEYLQQTSVIGDYNVFSGFFLFTITLGTFSIYKFESNRVVACIGIFLNLCFGATITLLTESRRSVYMLIGVFSVLLLYIAIQEIKNNFELKHIIKILTLLLFFISLVIIIIFSLRVFLQNYSNDNLEEKQDRIINTSNRTSFVRIITGSLYDLVADNERINTEHIGNNEYDSLDRLKNSMGSEMVGKRAYIWKAAVDEITTFSVKELIIGKGVGYSSKMYEKEPYLGIMESIYNKSFKNKELYMYPHNYILQDMLDGGIIKVFLSIVITLFYLYILLKRVFRNSVDWIIVILLQSLVFINIMISDNIGFLGDKYFIVVLCLEILYFDNGGKIQLEKNKKI